MPFQLVKPDTHIDFISKWRFCAAASLTLILFSLVAALTFRPPRIGIDFSGGTEIQATFVQESVIDEGAVRQAVGDSGIADATVVRFGELGVNDFLIKFRDAPDSTTEQRNQRHDALKAALVEQLGEVSFERVEYVGPRVGEELTRDGFQAMGIAALLILAYIAFRFNTRFAPGAVVAILHDVLITAGLWVLFGLEFDLKVLAALLAIIGYSLNDTIIVYDRIRETMELRTKSDLREVLNRSVNQTLSRTLLTSVTTLLAVLSLLFLGGEVIFPFAFAMAIGIVIGTYSSIYVAAPVLLFLETRYGGTTPAAKGARGARA